MDKPAVPASLRLSRLGPLPLHYQLSEDLRRRIAAGDFPPGSTMPSEAELVDAYRVSRGTVRQALAALRADGLVVGPRGTPPLVRGEQLTQPFTELLSFSAWVESLGRHPAGRVVEFAVRPADPELAARLRLEPGTPVHQLVRLRLADDEPLMVERTTLPPPVGALVAGIDLDRQSIYAELAQLGVVFAQAHQLIDAIDAPALDARLLGIAVHTPLLRIRRHSFAPDGTPLEWSEDRYVADRVTLSVETSAPRAQLVRRMNTARED